MEAIPAALMNGLFNNFLCFVGFTFTKGKIISATNKMQQNLLY